MKITKYLALGLLALSLTPVWGQPMGRPLTYQLDAANAASATNLTRFNLDFPGGTPKDLIAAIEKATGKPMNVIIPNEDAPTQLPALKMYNVTFPQLSETLRQSFFTVQYVLTPNGSFQQASYGSYFRTSDNDPTDGSAWFFFVQKPPIPAPTVKICRYYQLTPYLSSGLSVDDITTAIQTGWKMLGETSPPEINFHKETKLLIAVGAESQLRVIDDVLKALQPTTPGNFGQRLNSVINRTPQPPGQPMPPPPSFPTAPGQYGQPPVSPETQTLLIEAQRAYSQSSNSLPPPPAQKPPTALDAGK